MTWIRLGKEGFPLYLESTNGEIFSFDFEITEEEIVSHSNLVTDLLSQNDASKRTIIRCTLLVEELFMLIRERNPGKRLFAEMSIFILPDKVRLVMRDDGVIFDIADSEGKLMSFRSFVVTSLMDQRPMKNLTTMSFNRNMFEFPLKA